MDLNKNEIAELKSIIDAMSQNNLKNAGITKYISAIVYEVNSNGTCNLYIPPDTKNIVTSVPNKSGESLNIGDSVEICTKNGKMNNAWIAVKHGNSSGTPTYDNLNITNNLTVGGNSQLMGPSYVHEAQGTPGTAGYILIATIGVTNSYANHPIHFMISRRGAPATDFYFCFANANNTDPGIAYAYCSYPFVKIYYYKEMESTWNIYVQKSESYDHIAVLQYEQDVKYEGNNYFVNFEDVQDSSLPEGAVYVDSNIYPIGSVYTSTRNVSPQTFFGGSWTQLTGDAYFKIVTSSAGNYAGTSSEHKIPVESMPAHGHSISSSGAHYHNSTGRKGSGTSTDSIFESYDSAGSTRSVRVPLSGTNGAHTHTANNTGGGEAYYPYYYGVYAWVRTA